MDTVAAYGDTERGSSSATDEMARRGVRKARSFQYLDRLNKSLENLRMTNKSFERLEWMFAEDDEEDWDDALKAAAAKGDGALGSSVGEGEEASEEEPAEKMSDCDEEKIDSIALSLAKHIMRSMMVEEGNKALASFAEEEHRHDPFTILGVEGADILGMRGENEGTALWRVRMAQLDNDEATRELLKLELGRTGERKVEEEPKEEDTEMRRSDYEAWVASQFREEWTSRYSASCGSFDDTTRFGPMRFTDEPAPGNNAFPIDTLQVFSVKVVGIKRSLQWPLDVFGFVAVRDCIDKNRNIIFNRTRDNCQTLTEKDRHLVLTGPTRAIVWPTHVTIEVKLKMKGATESEDKDLSFLAYPLFSHQVRCSYLFRRYKTSKLSTLELTLGHIVDSVEATIFVRVVDGSWPDSRPGQFAAFSITGVRDKDFKSTDRQKIILLDSRGDKVLLTGDGEIDLLRRVVSVETRGTLKVCVKSWETSKGERNVVEDEWVFTPQRAKRSHGRLDTGFCKMEVTVAWSLVSYYPAPSRIAFPSVAG